MLQTIVFNYLFTLKKFKILKKKTLICNYFTKLLQRKTPVLFKRDIHY